MSNFDFLSPEWPDVHDSATKAEAATLTDPRTACFYARRALESAVKWVYKADSTLHLPYQDNLSALIHEPTLLLMAQGSGRPPSQTAPLSRSARVGLSVS